MKNTELNDILQRLHDILAAVSTGTSYDNIKISDTHAIGIIRARPSARHTTLCVNMARTMSEFFISTYEQLYSTGN